MSFTDQQLIEMLEMMIKIRVFEKRLEELFLKGEMPGTTHLYVGEEAIAVGSCQAINDDDYIVSHHRSHGHTLAKGVEVERVMAELFGKQAGLCHGRGGSLHLADFDRGHLGSTGVVGGGLPVAVGAGLSLQIKALDRVVVDFFGDGAMNQGTFHEAVNLASVWRLPVIFVCENNQYGMSSSVDRVFNIEDLSIRADSYGIPGHRVDGNDIFEVYQTVAEAARRAREGQGPSLIVAETYRWKGHSKSDTADNRHYRSKAEEKEWQKKDPLTRLENYLFAEGILDQKRLDILKSKIDGEIEEAVEFARQAPFPDKESVSDYVYAEEGN